MDVLVIEDEAPLRESLVEGLADAFGDLSVEGAGSAEEAESRLANASPRLIVSDVRLPGKGGAEFFLEVREKLPDTRFIFMSAYPSAEARKHARAHDIHFLHKPFEFADLLQSAERLLEDRNFSGELGGISLVDLLQVLNLGRRSATVSLRRRDREGRIFLEDGEVVHAMIGELTGRAAFDQLMAWEGGRFGSESGCGASDRTIHESFNGLLLDCLRVQDEHGAHDLQGLDGAFDFGDDVEGSDVPAPEASVNIESALQLIPGCVGVSLVDIRTHELLGLVPMDSEENVGTKIIRAVAALFESDTLRQLDASLSGAFVGGSSDAPVFREVIALAEGCVHHAQSLDKESGRVVLTMSRASKGMGTVVARARQWKKGLGARDGGA